MFGPLRQLNQLNRPLAQLALLGEIDGFYADYSSNFSNMCKYMFEKFDEEDAKNGNFNERMELRKRSNKRGLFFSHHLTTLGQVCFSSSSCNRIV